MYYELRHFPAQTSGAYDQPLAMKGKLLTVGTWFVVVAVGPCLADELYEVVVALAILGKHNQMEAIVALVLSVGHFFTGDIHLASEDRFELLLIGFPGVLFVDIVIKLLDAEHVAVVG